jgi:hypothetical protein
MKKIILILILKCSLTFAQQHIYFGLKVGLNRSQVIGDKLGGYNKPGFNGGVFSQLRLSKKNTAQFEVLFSEKGSAHSRHKNYPNYYATPPYFIKLLYIDLSFLFQIHQKKIVYEFGLGLGYLIEQKEDTGEPNRNLNDVKYPFSKTEKIFIIGLGYSFKDFMGVNFRYSNSIVPIRKTPSAQFNSVFTLALSYKTDFKKKKKTKEDE